MSKINRIEKCYNLIASNADNMDIDNILKIALKQIKGLKEIEFYAALELDNTERTEGVNELLIKLGY